VSYQKDAKSCVVRRFPCYGVSKAYTGTATILADEFHPSRFQGAADGEIVLDRRYFIGGSDARVIMGNDETNLIRLWRVKRGEIEPEDLSGNLIVQLGTVTEDLNRRWYERNTGHAIKDMQRRIQHPVIKRMAATLDGRVDPGGAAFEAKFVLPWTFSEEAAAEKHMAQLQHNMWVANARSAGLSIITGAANGSKWPLTPIRCTSIC